MVMMNILFFDYRDLVIFFVADVVQEFLMSVIATTIATTTANIDNTERKTC